MLMKNMHDNKRTKTRGMRRINKEVSEAEDISFDLFIVGRQHIDFPDKHMYVKINK